MTKVEFRPIGRVIDGYPSRKEAPRMGRLENRRSLIRIDPEFQGGLEGLEPGAWIWVVMWFDRADPPSLRIHPRGDLTRPKTGVFNTRSPNRPNPIALDLCRIIEIEDGLLTVEGLDGLVETPILDIKPYIGDFDMP